MDNLRKIKRTGKLVSVLTKYGFETLVTQTGLKKLIPKGFIEKNNKRKEVFSLTTYERVRMVLEELGPAYVKLGQLLSNRDDILPQELTAELQKLQDQVQTEDINICAFITEELGVEPDEIFLDIDTMPIASASLSQVYTATLKENGQKIVIKAKRKGIREVIEVDVLIIKDFADMLENYYSVARRMNLSGVARTFEKTILNELSFTQELSNIERFRKDMSGNSSVYVPVTYKLYSTVNMLCMEYIDGIKISDRELIQERGLQPEKIARKVVDSYMKQIVDHGFFHADPHSGNIFVTNNGNIAFIDFGSMGKLRPEDMENIGSFVINVINKDTHRLVRVIKKIAVRYEIPDDAKLERELFEVLDILGASSIKELDLDELMKRFTRLLNENKVILPEYMFLLIRGIVLLEGVGRELGLADNIIGYIEPYVKKVIKQRTSPRYITTKVVKKMYNLGDMLVDLPDELHLLLEKANNGDLKVNHRIVGISLIKNAINRMALALLISALGLGSSVIVLANMPPLVFGISLFGFLGFMLAAIMAILVLLSVFKEKRKR